MSLAWDPPVDFDFIQPGHSLRAMDNPVASVGIPFHNDAATLSMAVRSVFAQTRADWELILLDDGGRDGGLELARAIRDPRVRVISDGENRGLPRRLNELTSLSRGTFVVRMDADDIMLPTRVERQVDFLLDHPQVDLVASAVYVVDADDRVSGLAGGEPIHDRAGLFFKNGVIIHPSVATRRAWMLANPYDSRFRRTQDKELWLRTHAQSTFVNLPDPLLCYRLYGAFDLSKYREQRRTDRLLLSRFGPEQIGEWRTLTGLASSVLKESAYRGFSAINQEDGLQKLMNRKRAPQVTSAVRTQIQCALIEISATKVPGWI